MTGFKIAISRRDVAVALLMIALVSAICAAAFEFYDQQVESVLLARQATVVDSEIQLLSIIDRDEGRAALIRAIKRRQPFATDDFAIQALVGADGRFLAGDVDWPPDIIADGAWRKIDTFARRGIPVQGYGRAIVLADGAKVLVGRDTGGQGQVETSLAESMVVALFCILAGIVALGMYWNSLTLGRIAKISGSARRIISGDTGERFPAEAGTEFGQLSGVLNALLDRNQGHLRQMRLVTDAMAHDLRQPLQSIRAWIDVAARANDQEARQQALGSAVAAMNDGLATIDNLLEVARAEAGLGTDAFQDVALNNVANDMADLFGPLAEDKDQIVNVAAEPLHIHGHGALLRQALGNLIQNAIKYSPSGAHITVKVGRTADSADVGVQDDGPGIPADRYAEVVQPFGRLARDSDQDGKGLGLALVSACAKLHGGALVFEDARPGLRACMRLPLHRSSDAIVHGKS